MDFCCSFGVEGDVFRGLGFRCCLCRIQGLGLLGFRVLHWVGVAESSRQGSRRVNLVSGVYTGWSEILGRLRGFG